jgi:hypothetical protein
MGSYVDGDVSSGTTSLTDLSGLAWVAHGADDLALFLPACGDSTVTLNSFDSDFTSVSADLDTNVRSLVAKRTPATMTGSESGAITAQCSAGNRQSGALGIWNGYADVQQIVSQPETSGSATATHACPAITPQVAGSGFVLAFVERVSSTVAPASTPAGFTKREEFETGGTGGTSVVLYDDLSGTHPVGTPFTPASIVSQLASTSARVYLLELAPSTESHSGSLALSGAGAQALAGTPAVPGSLALSGVGTLAADGTPAVSGTIGLSGTGSQGDGGTPTMPGDVALAGAGQLDQTGTPAIPGAVALSGSGSLTSAGQPTLPGDLPLSGGGTLAFASSDTFTGALALAGAGALGLTGTPAIQGDLPLLGDGSIAAGGTPSAAGDLPLTGVGELASAGAPSFMQELTLAGVGVLALASEAPPSTPGDLVASVSQSLTASDSHSTLTATTEPASRLEASDGV